jgi:hypothetical protein
VASIATSCTPTDTNMAASSLNAPVIVDHVDTCRVNLA